MMFTLTLFAGLSLGQSVLQSEAKSPEESLKCIKTRPGFTVELMASEPLVMDPIAFAWGPDGKFWVVEMGDYPLGAGGKDKPGGRIKFLEKSRLEGPYDKATVFLDNLGYPTGVTPYKKGVLVTCAPDIFYAEDTDGDGKADVKKVLFTGFREGNQQHRVNGLVYGLDGWYYGANGDSGGKVKSMKTGEVVDISGRDFRIDPEKGILQTQSGQTQFGRARDDWGNWFGNNNSNPLFHFALDDQYLKRNPHFLPPSPKVQVIPGPIRVYPISKPLERFNNPQSVNHFTSACSSIIYRDGLFGPDFVGNVFISEPVHNLVHRQILARKGVTFTSRRADDEQESEFLASSDNWFRPTTIQTGPDGALWIADMYRYVIEHPEWIPKDWQKKLDLRAGHDKGRIYRVYPKDKKPRQIPNLAKLKPAGLIDRLSDPNGWVRDTAQQVLVGQDNQGFWKSSNLDEFVKTLNAARSKSKDPKARLHLLCTSELLYPGEYFTQLSGLIEEDHPEVQKMALRLTESGFNTILDYRKGLIDLLNSKSPALIQQAAYSGGFLSDVTVAPTFWAKGMAKHLEDPYIFAAFVSSLNERNINLVIRGLLESKENAALIGKIFPQVMALGKPRDLFVLITETVSEKQSDAGVFLVVGQLLDAMNKNPNLLEELKDEAKTDEEKKNLETNIERITKWVEKARILARDSKAPLADRGLALQLLARGIGDELADLRLLGSLLTPQTPDDLQGAVVGSLGRNGTIASAMTLVRHWKGLSPALRAQVLDQFLSRQEWTQFLLTRLEANVMVPAEIDTVRRQRLLKHPKAEVRQRAEKIFAGTVQPDRAKAIAAYQEALSKEGDAGRGIKVFTKSCAACHQVGDVGQAVGPDLKAVGDKSPQGLLIAILDPNRAVEPRYLNYVVSTNSGLILSGLLANETSTSISLVGADGKKHDLLRKDIEEMSSTGQSVMPEGLEKDISIAEMADLFAFLRMHLPVEKKK